MKIARPAARKSAARKPSKSGSSRPAARVVKTEPAAQPEVVAAPQNPRKVREVPKVVGELPTPTATFYF